MTTIAGALMVIETETLLQIDAVEEHEHVVERVDRHAQPADFAEARGSIAVEAHQRGQVERGR